MRRRGKGYQTGQEMTVPAVPAGPAPGAPVTAPEYLRVTVRTERADGSGLLRTYPRVRDVRVTHEPRPGLVDYGVQDWPVLTNGVAVTITGVCLPTEETGMVHAAEVIVAAPGWRVDVAQLQDWPHHATTRDGAPPVLVADLVADLLTAHARIDAALAELDRGFSWRLICARVRDLLTGR